MFDNIKKSALAAGGAVGLGVVVLGAPLWAGIVGGAAAVLATPKIIDELAKRKIV